MYVVIFRDFICPCLSLRNIWCLLLSFRRWGDIYFLSIIWLIVVYCLVNFLHFFIVFDGWLFIWYLLVHFRHLIHSVILVFLWHLIFKTRCHWFIMFKFFSNGLDYLSSCLLFLDLLFLCLGFELLFILNFHLLIFCIHLLSHCS